MKKPDRSNYTTLDFLQWQEAGTLVISPKFQRRGVWSRAAQSYLVDTLLLELPVPPIYLRVVQDAAKKTVVREVVDGQQRISAILSFVQDKFALAKNIESGVIGKRFSELSEADQNTILQFSFVCEVFYGVQDSEILKIFARLNTHSVKLNAQELRNGKYFGFFKRSAFALAFEHIEFWRQRKLFTEQNLARMQEVELTSELMIVLIEGLQDKKKSIESFYEKYDEDFAQQKDVEKKFRAVVDAINDCLGDDLKETEFRRGPIFYSLFTAVAHRMFGINGIKLETPATGKFTRADSDGLQEAVRGLSNVLIAAKDDPEDVSASNRAFVTACLRQTDNIRPRRTRLETIYRHAFSK